MIDLNPELILIADQLGIFIRLEQLEHFLPKIKEWIEVNCIMTEYRRYMIEN